MDTLYTQHLCSFAVADPKIQTNDRTLDLLAHSLVNRLSDLNGADQRIPTNHVEENGDDFQGSKALIAGLVKPSQMSSSGHLLDYVHGPEIRDNSELGS
jgi:hypothetical protein